MECQKQRSGSEMLASCGLVCFLGRLVDRCEIQDAGLERHGLVQQSSSDVLNSLPLEAQQRYACI